MTLAQIKPAPVRRSVFVKASPEHAFEVFTSGFDPLVAQAPFDRRLAAAGRGDGAQGRRPLV